MVLTGELQMAHIPILSPPQIPGWGPIIPSHKPGYMPLPPGPLGSWGSFTQAPGPSQDPGYTPGTSSGAGDDDDDDDDTDQYIKGDDSP